MSNDAKGIFSVLGCLAAAAAALAGWMMIVNSGVTFSAGCFWSAVYFLALSILLFALVGRGNPVAGYRWMVGNGD